MKPLVDCIEQLCARRLQIICWFLLPTKETVVTIEAEAGTENPFARLRFNMNYKTFIKDKEV